jgi:hypothetical protein
MGDILPPLCGCLHSFAGAAATFFCRCAAVVFFGRFVATLIPLKRAEIPL